MVYWFYRNFYHIGSVRYIGFDAMYILNRNQIRMKPEALAYRGACRTESKIIYHLAKSAASGATCSGATCSGIHTWLYR